MGDSGDYRVIASSQPVEFLEMLEGERADFAFLDICMGDMDGIRLGEAIRAKNRETMLIYISAFGQYALDAFRVRAFHYLLKPVERKAFNALMQEMLERLSRRDQAASEKHFAVTSHHHNIHLNRIAVRDRRGYGGSSGRLNRCSRSCRFSFILPGSKSRRSAPAGRAFCRDGGLTASVRDRTSLYFASRRTVP